MTNQLILSSILLCWVHVYYQGRRFKTLQPIPNSLQSIKFVLNLVDFAQFVLNWHMLRSLFNCFICFSSIQGSFLWEDGVVLKRTMLYGTAWSRDLPSASSPDSTSEDIFRVMFLFHGVRDSPGQVARIRVDSGH